MKPRAALWRLALSVVVAVVLLILMANVVTQPVAEDTRSYTAEFTDASGLHAGADVSVRGVRVGKVKSLNIERTDGRSIAAVEFSLDKRYGVVSDSRLAIKFQALTGVRYLDVVHPAEGYSAANLITRVSTAMTQPSFDVTALFNGLQPVLATLSPEDINIFTANVANFLSGDGGGLTPVLDSIKKLTEFVSDRQQVIAALMRNLSHLAESISGNSKELIQIIEYVRRPIEAGLTVLDEFRKSQLYGPGFTSEVVRLLGNAGITPDANIDTALDRAITVLDDNFDAFKFVPVMWETIPEPPDAGAPVQCSRGRAQLPEQMDVLLNGQRVVLCKR